MGSDIITESPRHLGIADLLEHDQRPAFITELREPKGDSISIIFVNASLRANPMLSSHIKGYGEANGEGWKAWLRFRDWTMRRFEDGPGPSDAQPTLTFRRIVWSRITLHDKWRVISANEGDPWAKKPTHIGLSSGHVKVNDKIGPQVGGIIYPAREIFTPTDLNTHRDIVASLGPTPILPMFAPDPSNFQNFVLNFDWASTELGPIESWPRKLREWCDFVIRDSRPASVYWGPKYNCIYNEAYASLIGSKHPQLMGMTIVDGWPESCDALIATMEKSRLIGRSSIDYEWQVFLERLDGRSEETYFSWSIVPVFEGNECPGYVSPVFETTKLRIGERRLKMLNVLGEYLAKGKDVKSFWQNTLCGLESANASDVPFALLYSALEISNSDTPSESSDSGSVSNTRMFQFEGSLGVPEGHPSAPFQLDLGGNGEGLLFCFREAVRSSGLTIFRTDDDTFSEELLEGFQWRGSGDACTTIAVLALRPTKDENVMGLLMIGLNPRRPYDDEHQQFISLLHSKLATSLASSILLEEEIRRGRNSAEQASFDRAWLSEQLSLRTQEVDDATRRFQAVGEVVPVGICFSTPEGHVTYANCRWYNMTGFEKGTRAAMSFMNCVFEEDAAMVDDHWRRLVSCGLPTEFEFRIKSTEASFEAPTDGSTPTTSTNGSVENSDTTDSLMSGIPGVSCDVSPKWALATVSAVRAKDGSVEMVTISLTDITIHKRTAEEAIQRAQQAERLSELLSRFKRMADFATVGLFDLTPRGKIAQANDTFYNILGIKKSELEGENPRCWPEAIVDEDLPIIYKNFQNSAIVGKPIADEIRLKKPWVDSDAAGNPVAGQTWILATTLPVKDSSGTVTGLTGCVTDISVQKAKARIALERADLLNQVLIRTQEAKSSEEKFARFAEAAPIGISIMTGDGCINYCNETWFNITHHPRDVPLDQPFPWIAQVEDEDLHIVQSAWQDIMATHVSTTIEFRLKHPWHSPGSSSERPILVPTWVQSSYFPEVDGRGNVKSIMSCLSDISHFKWAESIQKQRTVEALESKRQQENFIDMTSHEMRNPLSAVVQCADLIVGSLDDIRILLTEDLKSTIDASIDAAQTIISCARHQKSIVDDILTLSKLDSDLLAITTVPVNPKAVMQEAVKIFAAESRRAEIKLSLAYHKSVSELKIEWLLLDPSRLLQVLINLLTNALKFTQTGAMREVTVTMSVFVEKPSQHKTSISYIPTRSFRDELLSASTPPRGNSREPLYLHFAVQDTGRGLTDAEKKLLFKRFSQASPRTHVQYGGSGLGLFISRELTELQGGEIGVASEPGVGSTFAFYVKTQRTSPLDDAMSTPKISAKKTSGLHISVLVVEDNLINQAVLSKQLRNLGCTVDVANHGGEALEFIKASRYWKGNAEFGRDLTIILLDIEMPVMDGLTCIKTIRVWQQSGDITGHIPTIAVSANARNEQIAAAKAAGMDDVVVKPFRIPDLVPKITSLLELLGYS